MILPEPVADAAHGLDEARPGRVVGEETVILKGLQAGEKVVTDGQIRLVPGKKIQIKNQGK